MNFFKSLPADFPWATVQNAANKHGLDVMLVAAVCFQESGGDTWASRVEFKRLGKAFASRWKYYWRVKEFAKAVNVTEITETVHQATSWGLMQCMGTVAREHGFKEDLPKLCKPSVGLEYGCIHLKSKITRWGSIESGLAAYNAGSPRKKLGSILFVNQVYVDSVQDKLEILEMEKEAANEKRNSGYDTRQENTDKRGCDSLL